MLHTIIRLFVAVMALVIGGCAVAQPAPTLTSTPTETPLPTSTPTITLTPTLEFAGVFITRDLPVYAGPGLNYEVLRTLEASAGTPIPIYAISPDGNWVLITRGGGQTGEWLGLSPFVQLAGDLSQAGVWGATPVPSATQPPTSTHTAAPTFTPTLSPVPSATPAPSITPQPTLDMDAVVGTVQVAVLNTLVAQAEANQIAQVTAQAVQQATRIAQENLPVDVSQDDDPAIGPDDALVVIIEFSDFKCPYCGQFARETLPQILEVYEGEVRFVFRDAPILGQESVNGALAAECADDQERFWDYHDLLYRNQRETFDLDTLVSFARQLDLNMREFNACLDDQTHLDDIRGDYQDSQDAGLTGTPTLFVNGRRVVGAQSFEVFARIIDEELAKAP